MRAGPSRPTPDRDRPDPTEDIPGDAPTGQGDGRFDLGTLGPGVPGAASIGAMVELADQFDGAVLHSQVAVAVVADVHHPPAGGAVAVEDIEFPEGEVRILGPELWHDGDALVEGATSGCFSRSTTSIRTNRPGSQTAVWPLFSIPFQSATGAILTRSRRSEAEPHWKNRRVHRMPLQPAHRRPRLRP